MFHQSVIRCLIKFVFLTGATVRHQRCNIEDDLDLCLDVRIFTELGVVFEEQQDVIIRMCSTGRDWEMVSARKVVAGKLFHEILAVKGRQL